tara:strand:+ start:279 stop:698 length:420 start_codon:yes stop_codon:yes gene_type:complete
MKYDKYLGIKHSYTQINCVSLLDIIYKEQLHSNAFTKICGMLDIKSLYAYKDKQWMHNIKKSEVEACITSIARKIILTDIQEYDVILFRHKKVLTHFGMYIGQNSFIHVEEGRESKIDKLTDKWREEISSIWRLNGTDI